MTIAYVAIMNDNNGVHHSPHDSIEMVPHSSTDILPNRTETLSKVGKLLNISWTVAILASNSPYSTNGIGQWAIAIS